MTTGRCYACGYKGWCFIRPEEASKWSEEEAKRKKPIILGITLALIILALIMLVILLIK